MVKNIDQPGYGEKILGIVAKGKRNPVSVEELTRKLKVPKTGEKAFEHEPVSYTHLDVYKRQLRNSRQRIPSPARKLPRRRFGGHRCGLSPWEDSWKSEKT